jgi:hypothetical protein
MKLKRIKGMKTEDMSRVEETLTSCHVSQQRADWLTAGSSCAILLILIPQVWIIMPFPNHFHSFPMNPHTYFKRWEGQVLGFHYTHWAGE